MVLAAIQIADGCSFAISSVTNARRLGQRWLCVVFQIADRLARHAGARPAPDSARHPDRSARRIASGRRKASAKKNPPAAIARKRPVGNPAVHNQQATARAFRFAIKHRPDFGLENHHHRRTNARQHAPHGERVVDGSVENAVHQSHSTALRRCRGPPPWLRKHTAECWGCAREFPAIIRPRKPLRPPKPHATRWRPAASAERTGAHRLGARKTGGNSADRGPSGKGNRIQAAEMRRRGSPSKGFE